MPSLVRASDENHAGDGPWILVALGAILLALLFLELGRGGLGPKTVALLGVLGAAMVALRLPGFVAGFSAMFIVVLVAGNAFGPSFGFLLGAVGTFASGLFLGGLGPWLPFQMVAVGWVGAGAGLLPHGNGWTTRIAWLAGYGVVSGYAFGMIMGLVVLAVPDRRLAARLEPHRRRGDEPAPLPRVLRGGRVRVGLVPRGGQRRARRGRRAAAPGRARSRGAPDAARRDMTVATPAPTIGGCR